MLYDTEYDFHGRYDFHGHVRLVGRTTFELLNPKIQLLLVIVYEAYNFCNRTF